MSASGEAIRRETEVSTVIHFEVFSRCAVPGSLGEDDALVGIVECHEHDDGDVITFSSIQTAAESRSEKRLKTAPYIATRCFRA